MIYSLPLLDHIIKQVRRSSIDKTSFIEPQVEVKLKDTGEKHKINGLYISKHTNVGAYYLANIPGAYIWDLDTNNLDYIKKSYRLEIAPSSKRIIYSDKDSSNGKLFLYDLDSKEEVVLNEEFPKLITSENNPNYFNRDRGDYEWIGENLIGYECIDPRNYCIIDLEKNEVTKNNENPFKSKTEDYFCNKDGTKCFSENKPSLIISEIYINDVLIYKGLDSFDFLSWSKDDSLYGAIHNKIYIIYKE